STRPEPCWPARGVTRPRDETPMRRLIWGAGAIGGTGGADLARAAADVTMVDTVVEHVNAIASGGLRLTGPNDQFTARVRAFTGETRDALAHIASPAAAR